MKKKTLMSIALCIFGLSATQAKNFWLKFDGQNVEAENSKQNISKWFNLPSESSFELQKDYTDYIGYRHQVYQQYIAGIKVEGGIVKVHSLNGRITSANGNVIERKQTQNKALRLSANGSKVVDDRNVVIVETNDGVYYTSKTYDIINNEDVYTDVETGNEIKRLPRKYYADILTSGQSLYSGTCDFLINQAENGQYVLTDSTRRIYTLDARHASTSYRKFPSTNPDEKFDVGKYVMANTIPLYNPDKNWSLLSVDSMLIDSVGKSKDNYWSFHNELYYKDINGLYRNHAKAFATNNQLPIKIDMTTFYTEANVPSTLILYWTEGEDRYVEVKDTLECMFTEPGVYPWYAIDGNGVTRARGRYFVSRTAHFAVDVHWGMEQTYDFYKNVFHRDSYDNEGAPIYNVVYPILTNYALEDPVLVFTTGNAAAQMSPSFCYMVYGIGSNTRNPMVSLDFLAHEFTHMMTYKTSNLEYQGESGALNESFSDIIGITIKQKAKNCPDNWLMGDELVVDPAEVCIRNMKDPESNGHASKYQGENWVDPSYKFDYGGVHYNSGVQSLWYYLLVEGGEYTDATGVTHTIEGIGTDKAIQIAFRNVSEMLTSTAQYKDAVLGSLQAAEDLYGKESTEYQSVKDAWAAVGLGEDGTTNIVRASTSSEKASDDFIYQLDGTRVNTSTNLLAPGIYIKNGKKFIVGRGK